MRKLLILLLISILAIFVFIGCKGLVPNNSEPAEEDVTTINGQIKMPGACCDPLEEEKQGISRAKSTYDETELWTIIPGAMVELKDSSNCKIVDKTVSDEAGYYEFEDVQPGLYIITAYCPSNEQYLLKDVDRKVSGQALEAGIPDCDSTSLALVIEYLEDCYNDFYLCFNKYTQIYRMVEKIAEDVGEVDIPAILDHDDFGVLDDDDEDDLVDLVCDKLMGCCVASGPGGGGSTPAPAPCADNIAPQIIMPNNESINPGQSDSWIVNATDVNNDSLTFSLVSVVPEPTNDFTIDATTGVVSWDPTCADIIGDIDTTYTITVEVDDGCTTVQDSFEVTLLVELCGGYILTVNVIGDGIVDIAPDLPSYDSGEVTLDPTADTGWVFTGWSGDNAGDLVDNVDGTWTINMDANKIVTATFEFYASPAPVDLGTSANFVILSESGIFNIPLSAITGDIGTSPISATEMNTVTCPEMLTGTIYGVNTAYTGSGDCFQGDAAAKTLVDTAVSDMETAYTNAAGRIVPAPVVNLGAGNIGGLTIYPGIYKWSTGVNIATDVTLSGGANDVWIFQIAGDLTIAAAGDVDSGIKVLLEGGAQASNIFWQVGGGAGATLGTYSTFEGTILSATQVVLQTGAVLNGRAFAQTQVTLNQSTVTLP